MERTIRCDKANDRLIFVARKPDQDYWESVWDTLVTKEAITRGDRFVVEETRRVLPQGARVIDAGCGTGATVHGLQAAGFDAYGIDYAERTVAATKSLFSELKISVGDVRVMPFADGYFDGVWSLGVIEHFYDGYLPIVDEAFRVLKPGGYLFLTVPTISPLKRLKMRLGLYADFDQSERPDFFQFAFHADQTVRTISRRGFRLCRSFGRSGAMGLSEDASVLSRWILPDPENRSFLARAAWRGMDIIFRPISFHMGYFLFRKVDSPVA